MDRKDSDGAAKAIGFGVVATFLLAILAGPAGAFYGGSYKTSPNVVTGNLAVSGAIDASSYADHLGAFAATTSAQLAGVLSNETGGAGVAVFNDTPTLIAPILGTPTSATLTNATGLPMTTGVTGILAGTNGGTGINNSTKTITLGNNLTTSGNFALTLTQTATTNVTLPTTGTLATLAGTETLTNKTISTGSTFNAGAVTSSGPITSTSTSISPYTGPIGLGGSVNLVYSRNRQFASNTTTSFYTITDANNALAGFATVSAISGAGESASATYRFECTYDSCTVTRFGVANRGVTSGTVDDVIFSITGDANNTKTLRVQITGFNTFNVPVSLSVNATGAAALTYADS